MSALMPPQVALGKAGGLFYIKYYETHQAGPLDLAIKPGLAQIFLSKYTCRRFPL
jgi:hypothetical protein